MIFELKCYRTVCSYLSPQRPYKRAYEQQPAKVQAFLEITPALA